MTKPETQIHRSGMGKVPGQCAHVSPQMTRCPVPKAWSRESGPLPQQVGRRQASGGYPQCPPPHSTPRKRNTVGWRSSLRGPGPLSLCTGLQVQRSPEPSRLPISFLRVFISYGLFSLHPVNSLRACLHPLLPALLHPPQSADNTLLKLQP